MLGLCHVWSVLTFGPYCVWSVLTFGLCHVWSVLTFGLCYVWTVLTFGLWYVWSVLRLVCATFGLCYVCMFGLCCVSASLKPKWTATEIVSSNRH